MVLLGVTISLIGSLWLKAATLTYRLSEWKIFDPFCGESTDLKDSDSSTVQVFEPFEQYHLFRFDTATLYSLRQSRCCMNYSYLITLQLCLIMSMKGKK